MYRKKSGFFFLAGSAGTWLSFQRLVSFRTRISHPSVCFFYSFLLLSIIPSPCVQCVGRPNRFQHKINGRGSRLNHPFPMHDRARRRRKGAGGAVPRRPDARICPPPRYPAGPPRLDSADKMDARESPFEILFYGLPSLKAMQSRETHVFSDRVGTTDCALLAPPRRSKILTRKLRRHMVDR